MALALASWFPQAQSLKHGQSSRVVHECGSGKNMAVSNDERGYHAYCFRCNDSGWAPAQREPLVDRLARLSKLNHEDNLTQQAVLPAPRVYEWGSWPDNARLWLLKAGLSSHDAGKLGAFYHLPTQRVVLPCFWHWEGHSEVVYWQARALDGRMPKYLGSPVGKAQCVPMYGQADTVTLTEDLLSAYKVGTVAEGWCLLGTKMSQRCLHLLVQRGCKVNVWLDPDGAGMSGATKTLAALRGAGIEARRIVSARDPKLMHREQIKELLT